MVFNRRSEPAPWGNRCSELTADPQHDDVPGGDVGVNQETTGVVGLGKFCLITSDIVYGIFDTGIIKGYVFSPGDPHPLVEDLEASSRGMGTTPQACVDGMRDRFEDLLPGERQAPSATHLNSVLLALSSLEKNRERATRSTS